MKLSRTRSDAPAAAPDVAAPVSLPLQPQASPASASSRPLGEILVEAGLLSAHSLAEALTKVSPERRLGEVLLDEGLLTERLLASSLANQRGMDFLDLSQVTPSPEALTLLSEATARSLLAIPVLLEDSTVRVAVADPTPEIIAEVRSAFSLDVDPAVATPSDVRRAITNNYRALAGVGAYVQAFTLQNASRTQATTQATNDSSPAAQVVQMIVTQGMRDRASDIHIEPQDTSIRIRFRIDGALVEVLTLPLEMAPVVVSRIKVLAEMNIVERRRPQDGQFTLEVDGREVDVRVATTATIWGEKVVLRLLDKSRSLYRLSDLGMPSSTASRFSRLLEAPSGMVVCAGPTGSGKTTTLYSSLTRINKPELNITTIEDPVEYTFPSITQIQINEPAGVTFATGLRSILRQDPDVILVGEVRDVETARTAVQAALTGHLVLSSLHATDATSALFRLLDMGIEPFLVASSVTAVVSQRLLRRVCTYCATSAPASPEEEEYLSALGGTLPEAGLVHGEGCTFCSHTGFLERVGVYELLPISEAIRRLVLRGASYSELRDQARSEGMTTLQEGAVSLVEAGITTVSEVIRSIYVMEA